MLAYTAELHMTMEYGLSQIKLIIIFLYFKLLNIV